MPPEAEDFLACGFFEALTIASVTIITATLIVVAAIERRIMKRENDFCPLNAIRPAIKFATLKR